MHNYILERAANGKIKNYRKSQEEKLAKNKNQLALIETTPRDNFLTELELDTHKTILLKKAETIEKRLADMPAIEETMTPDAFFDVVKDIMIKANITSDENEARELKIMLDILKRADEEKAGNFDFK